MEYFLGQEEKLLKDVEKKLKEYCKKYNDSDCFPNRLQLIIEPVIKPPKILLSDVSEAIENLEQIIKFKPRIFTLFKFHIEDVIEDKTIITFTFYFKRKPRWPIWDVEYLEKSLTGKLSSLNRKTLEKKDKPKKTQ